jgi:hypothetical protein
VKGAVFLYFQNSYRHYRLATLLTRFRCYFPSESSLIEMFLLKKSY